MGSSSNENDAVGPHAVMLPYPAQGHIKPFMQLAKILHARGFYITFVNTQFTQERILKSEMATRDGPLTSFRFEALPDGLPPEHGRTLNVPELSESLTKNLPSHFRALIHRLNSSAGVPPVTCIISDGILSFPQDVANELGVQRIAFWTPSACGFSAYFFVPLLIQKGYIPLKEEGCLSNGYLEEEITCIPGIPSLRVKDLPSGWNSTLESICAGVPMISWPWFAEQQTNRRFASTVWQIGLEMNDVVERGEVEQMVRILMSGEEGKEMRKRALMLKDAAKRAVQKGGPSSNYLEKLVQRLAMKRAPMNN